MIRAIMHGCNGRMGRVITEMTAKEPEMEIVAGRGCLYGNAQYLSGV